MSSELCGTLSDEIINQFPKEDKETYYVWRRKKAPMGQLWDRYQNQCRKGRTSKSHTVITPMEEVKINNTDETSVEDQQSMCIWLANHNEPWPEIERKWIKTVYIRHHLIINSKEYNVCNIIKQWPLYKHKLGYTLIDVDYKYLYKNESDIKNKWPKFVEKIIPILKNRIKDTKYLEQINTLENNPVEEYKNFMIIYILHCLLTPSISKKGANERKKYSIKDSQDSFMLLVHDSSLISEKINFLEQECLINKITLQPIVIVVGQLDTYMFSEFLVYFDKTFYKVFTFLQAVDTCFKIYQLFNLKYPEQSEILWEFIQKYFYEVKTKFDKKSTKITSLISDIN